MPKFPIGSMVRVKFVFNPENKRFVGQEYMVVGHEDATFFLFGRQTMYVLNNNPTPPSLGWLEEQLEPAVPPEDFVERFKVEELLEGAEGRKKLPDVLVLSTCKELICVPQR